MRLLFSTTLIFSQLQIVFLITTKSFQLTTVFPTSHGSVQLKEDDFSNYTFQLHAIPLGWSKDPPTIWYGPYPIGLALNREVPYPSDLFTRSSWPENIPDCSILSGWLSRHPPEPESRKFVIDFRLHCDHVNGYAPEFICGAINWGFSGPLQSGDPCSEMPSWCIPKLWPISWAIMNPLARPISWFILHDRRESHIPWTPARPSVPQGAFCFAQIS